MQNTVHQTSLYNKILNNNHANCSLQLMRITVRTNLIKINKKIINHILVHSDQYIK